MSIFTLYNCIAAGVIAWIVAGLFTEETHERAAGFLVVLYELNKRFKAVLWAFSCLVVNSAITTQKAVFRACRHVKTIYNKSLTIQATPETHAGTVLTVSRCPKPETKTRPKSGKNRNISVIFNRFVTERNSGVCVIFENFRYTDRLTGVVFKYRTEKFLKKFTRKTQGCVSQNLVS